jgi:hypothetical protein
MHNQAQVGLISHQALAIHPNIITKFPLSFELKFFIHNIDRYGTT